MILALSIFVQIRSFEPHVGQKVFKQLIADAGVKVVYNEKLNRTPRKGECENLFVPVCLSASHVAHGSIRMEPVFMVLSQSAATAASHAINENLPVQEVDYEELRERLLADKQKLN